MGDNKDKSQVGQTTQPKLSFLQKLKSIDQYQAASYLYVFLIAAAILVDVLGIVQNYIDKRTLVASFVAIFFISFSYWLHRRHWKYSDWLLIVLLSGLIALGTPEELVSTSASLAVLLPAMIAALIAKDKAAISIGTLLTLSLLLARGEWQGVYADPINLIIIMVAIVCLTLTRTVLENTSEAHKGAEHWRQLSETYLKSIGDGVVAIDRNWNITLFNPAAARISGWSKEEAMGTPLRSVLKFIRERDRVENITFIEHAMVTGNVGTLEDSTLLITKDGKEIPVGDSAAPVFDLDNKIVGAVIVFRDISKQQDSKLLHSDFAYMSHQLRTPVNEAMLTFEAVLEEKDPAKISGLTQTAYSLMKSALRVSEQALMVSDLDEKVVIPKTKNVQVGVLLKGLIEQAKAKASLHTVGITLVMISGEIEMKTDPNLLSRALSELIINSIMYSPPGQAIRLEASSSDKGTLIEVHDTGLGITQEEQAFIFTKFFRGSNFDKAKLPGAGLGLYISHELVGLLGGKIWFSSTESKGTTFSILLPK